MKSNIIIREFRETDLGQLVRLFHDTVHSVNARDYSATQLDAWAPADIDLQKFGTRLAKNCTFVAELNGFLVGFGSITRSGLVDLLYVHKDFQKQGIGARILKQLEQYAFSHKIYRLNVEASITAIPFFKSKGYKEIRGQIKKHKGIDFINYLMHKRLICLLLPSHFLPNAKNEE